MNVLGYWWGNLLRALLLLTIDFRFSFKKNLQKKFSSSRGEPYQSISFLSVQQHGRRIRFLMRQLLFL